MTTIDDCKAAIATFDQGRAVLLSHGWTEKEEPGAVDLLREALAELAAERGQPEGAVSSEWQWSNLTSRWRLIRGDQMVAGVYPPHVRGRGGWSWYLTGIDASPTSAAYPRQAMREAAEAAAKALEAP